MAPCAIIGGTGRLPEILADRLGPGALSYHPAGVTFGTGQRAARPFRIERLGAFFDELRVAGVGEVVFAGAVRRPALDPGRFDATTAALAPRLVAAMQAGDDATLRAVVAIFEAEGFAVRGAHELAPELLPPSGFVGTARPSERDAADATRAAGIVAALGAADVGQACIVQQGQALAVEALPGTTWMLETLAERPGSWRPPAAAGRGVLFKAPKPGQDRRVDLPAIGPETVREAARADLAGVVVVAGGVLVLEAEAVRAAADKAGLFVWVREAGA